MVLPCASSYKRIFWEMMCFVWLVWSLNLLFKKLCQLPRFKSWKILCNTFSYHTLDLWSLLKNLGSLSVLGWLRWARARMFARPLHSLRFTSHLLRPLPMWSLKAFTFATLGLSNLLCVISRIPVHPRINLL